MPRYQISLKAENLSRGLFRRPSPFAELRFVDGPRKGEKVGRTETLEGTTNPDFVRLLFIEVDDDTNVHKVQIKLFDFQVHGTSDLLGTVEMEPILVFKTQGHTQTFPLGRGKATMSVSVVESNPSQMGRVHLQLRGLDIRNVEPGLLGLGRSDPFFEIGKKDADQSSGKVRHDVVYRSRHIRNHLNPYWDAFEIGLEELCNGDLNHPLQIKVWDFNQSGRHTEIGRCETTLAHMIQFISVKGNADRDNAFELFVEGDPTDVRGLICVLKAQVETESA